MTVRSVRISWIILVVAGFSISAFCQEKVSVPVSPPLIVDQHIYTDSINACGPASILNLLTFGSAPYQKAAESLLGGNSETRFRFLTERYFKGRPSVVIKGRKRWGVHGIMSADLVEGINELLKDNKIQALQASYLDKRAGESDAAFLIRIHKWISDSVSRGVPPILSLRSYAVRREKGKEEEPAWASTAHHYVVITSVPKKLETSPPSRGFVANVIDSNGGIQRPVYIHLESNAQAFRALKGVDPGGQWLDGRPFLLVEASQIRSLRPADLKWSERFIVVANFLIGDF